MRERLARPLLNIEWDSPPEDPLNEGAAALGPYGGNFWEREENGEALDMIGIVC